MAIQNNPREDTSYGSVLDVSRLESSETVEGEQHPFSDGETPERNLFQGTSILYVEDLSMFQYLMRMTCERLQWDLTIATIGQEGVSLALSEDYDIVLMDIQLGEESDFNGYEAAQRIKEIKPHLIIVSFSSDPMDERVHLGAVMDGHIEKNPRKIHILTALEPFLLQIKLDKDLKFPISEDG